MHVAKKRRPKAQNALGRQIESARRKLNLSQAQAAEKWGVGLHTLQTWEQGIRRPRGLALTHLQTLLDQALQQR